MNVTSLPAMHYKHRQVPHAFDRGGITRRSIALFRESRGEFDAFVEAWAFKWEQDAVEHGFFQVHESGDQPEVHLHHTESPGLVLQDAVGHQLWLSGCSCGYGGEGPSGSQTVLREAGFSKDAIEAIPYYDVLHLRSDSPEPTVIRKRSLYDFGGIDGDSYRISDDRMFAFDQRPVIVTKVGYGHKGLEDLLSKCDRYGQSWVDSPRTAVLWLDDDQAKEHGYYYEPGQGLSQTYNLIVSGLSGRQLWMWVRNDEELPPLARIAVEALGRDRTEVERRQRHRPGQEAVEVLRRLGFEVSVEDQSKQPQWRRATDFVRRLLRPSEKVLRFSQEATEA